jgi:threonine/homoserine/homoserine lactone efflux protein
MTDGLLLLAKARHFGEFARDPLLTIACVLLVVVSVGWVVVTRLISRNLRRALLRRQRAAQRRVGGVRPSRDIWSEPPP